MEIFEQFGVQPVLLAAQAVNFLVLLFILKKFLYGPVLRVLDERKKRIAQSLKEAEEIEKKLAKTEEDRQKTLQKALDEAQRLIDDATKSANQIVGEARGKAVKDMEEIMKKGQEAVRLEKEKMRQEIRQELGELVAISLEKVVKKSLNLKDQKRLIQETLKEV